MEYPSVQGTTFKASLLTSTPSLLNAPVAKPERDLARGLKTPFTISQSIQMLGRPSESKHLSSGTRMPLMKTPAFWFQSLTWMTHTIPKTLKIQWLGCMLPLPSAPQWIVSDRAFWDVMSLNSKAPSMRSYGPPLPTTAAHNAFAYARASTAVRKVGSRYFRVPMSSRCFSARIIRPVALQVCRISSVIGRLKPRSSFAWSFCR